MRGHLETFLAEQRARANADAPALPWFVERELRAYLECGILARGFLRVRCDRSGDELLVAFACKSRTVCPSCAGRRMHDTADFLDARVLPDVPYRQWVMSFPPQAGGEAGRQSSLNGARDRLPHGNPEPP